MSDQRAKDPAHVANDKDRGASLEVLSLRYYENYDMLGILNVCWYLDRPVECVLIGQAYKRISIFTDA